jgi:hypothetical protein
MRLFKWMLFLVAGSVAVLLSGPEPARSEDIPEEFRDLVRRGLNWMAKEQAPDGHWEAFGGQYPITMTGLGGMSLLMEGSTVREGKYKDRIKKARDYLLSKVQQGGKQDGMIGNPNTPGESGRYVYGHGFALMFLACAFGDEEDGEVRRKMEDALVRASQFSHNAQTRRKARDGKTDIGGWGYVSAAEGNNFDEGSVTITQVQALRAARNAGIKVPPEAIPMAVAYLKESTNQQGGVIYSLGQGAGGDGRPALTAAAISCGFSAGDYNSPLVKSWFSFCKERIPLLGAGRLGHDEYTHYYYAQAMYMLGDEGWKKLFPNDKTPLTWSKYRKDTFDYLQRTVVKEGNDHGYWTGGHVGPCFITAVHLTILQLDKAALPIYQR